MSTSHFDDPIYRVWLVGRKKPLDLHVEEQSSLFLCGWEVDAEGNQVVPREWNVIPVPAIRKFAPRV